jgi:hypothetical protein
MTGKGRAEQSRGKPAGVLEGKNGKLLGQMKTKC